MNKLKMLVLTTAAAVSLAAAGTASAQDNNGSQSTGVGAGRPTFEQFSITRKPTRILWFSFKLVAVKKVGGPWSH